MATVNGRFSSDEMRRHIELGHIVYYRGERISDVSKVPSDERIATDDALTSNTEVVRLTAEINERIERLSALGASVPQW